MTMEEKMAQVEAQAAAKAAGAAPEAPEMITGHLDIDQLMGMKMNDLKALANDMGLTCPFGAKKEDLAALIAAQPVQAEKTAIVEGNDEGQTAAAGLLIDEDDEDQATEDDEDQTDEKPEIVDVPMEGRVLVTYTGMVNLRDEDMKVVDQAMQGQVLPVTGKREIDGAVWYRVENRHGAARMISADVVRYMA